MCPVKLAGSPEFLMWLNGRLKHHFGQSWSIAEQNLSHSLHTFHSCKHGVFRHTPPKGCLPTSSSHGLQPALLPQSASCQIPASIQFPFLVGQWILLHTKYRGKRCGRNSAQCPHCHIVYGLLLLVEKQNHFVGILLGQSSFGG